MPLAHTLLLLVLLLLLLGMEQTSLCSHQQHQQWMSQQGVWWVRYSSSICRRMQ
jgi:hypothetical protein